MPPYRKIGRHTVLPLSVRLSAQTERENRTFSHYSLTNLLTRLIFGMKAYFINMQLLVPRSRSSAKVKVKYKGYISQKMAVSGAFVFHKHILFFMFSRRFFFMVVKPGGFVLLRVISIPVKEMVTLCYSKTVCG